MPQNETKGNLLEYFKEVHVLYAVHLRKNHEMKISRRYPYFAKIVENTN
jgi:hypothetical protein